MCFVYQYVCIYVCILCTRLSLHPTRAHTHTHTYRGVSPKMLVAESAAAELARVLHSRRRPGCMSLSLHPEPYTLNCLAEQQMTRGIKELVQFALQDMIILYGYIDIDSYEYDMWI